MTTFSTSVLEKTLIEPLLSCIETPRLAMLVVPTEEQRRETLAAVDDALAAIAWDTEPVDCSTVAHESLTEHLLHRFRHEEIGRPVPTTVHFTRQPEGRHPFVNKAMAWLQLSEWLISDEPTTAKMIPILSHLAEAETEMRQEVFRLIRFYLTHRPQRSLILLLTEEESYLIPEEYRCKIVSFR